MADNGYKWADKSQQSWAKTWDDNINLINPPAGCYTKYSTHPDVTISDKLGTCPFGSGYTGWDKEMARTGCDILGSSCQGIMYRSGGAGGRDICKSTDPQSMAAASELCWQPYQTFVQGYIDDAGGSAENIVPNTNSKCGTLGKCNRGGSKYVMLKEKPVVSNWVWADKSQQSWAKTWENNINLINPPAGCYTKYSTRPDVKISDKLGTCPFGSGYTGWDKEMARTGCDILGSSCQGIMYRSGGAGGRDICKSTDPQSLAAASELCWQPYQTFVQGYIDDAGGSAENIVPNTNSKCGTLGKCNRGGSKYVMLKEGSAGPFVPPAGLWCLASITKIPKVVNGNIEHVEIKDLKVGDTVQTTRGNMPISYIMKTDTKGYIHDNYVKVEKGALGENVPSDDLYITHEHSFSLGYYKNSLLNRNIYDDEQDNMVYLHITADQLADKLPGVTRVSKEFESAINLVFDEHTSINVYGIDVVLHHPKGNPYTLPKDKYQDKSKFNNKVQKPLFVNYDMLVNAKPQHMVMKDFLRGCITAYLDNKLTLKDVNNISFTHQKTMITADIRQKLKMV